MGLIVLAGLVISIIFTGFYARKSFLRFRNKSLSNSVILCLYYSDLVDEKIIDVKESTKLIVNSIEGSEFFNVYKTLYFDTVTMVLLDYLLVNELKLWEILDQYYKNINYYSPRDAITLLTRSSNAKSLQEFSSKCFGAWMIINYIPDRRSINEI